jgi:hypothetical protein
VHESFAGWPINWRDSLADAQIEQRSRHGAKWLCALRLRCGTGTSPLQPAAPAGSPLTCSPPARAAPPPAETCASHFQGPNQQPCRPRPPPPPPSRARRPPGRCGTRSAAAAGAPAPGLTTLEHRAARRLPPPRTAGRRRPSFHGCVRVRLPERVRGQKMGGVYVCAALHQFYDSPGMGSRFVSGTLLRPRPSLAEWQVHVL